MKRFQNCNKVVKIFRYRWYLLIPFQYVYYSLIYEFKVYIDEIKDGEINFSNNFDVITGKKLWEILIGMAQTNMNWYYTMDEVKSRIFKTKKNGRKTEKK